MMDIIERLRGVFLTISGGKKVSLRAANAIKNVSLEAADKIERLREQCDRMASLAIDNAKDTGRAMRLREALREIYEVYAGSEGIPQPMTAAEGYLLSLLMEVVRIAQNALKEKE